MPPKLTTQNEGFRGAMTLPRELRIRDGKMLQNPVREMEKLRGQAIHSLEIASFRGECFEIQATLNIENAWREPVGFRIGKTTTKRPKSFLCRKIRRNPHRPHPVGHHQFSPGVRRLVWRCLHRPASARNHTANLRGSLFSVEVFAQNGEIYGAAADFSLSPKPRRQLCW
jgi:hypothetical protein